jgi:ABC-type uncharacterized transport system permease subunit
MMERIWLDSAATLYLLASVGYGAYLALRRPALVRAARFGTIGAVVLHTVAIGIQCTLSATAWAVALAFLLLNTFVRPRPDALGAVALPVAFLCLFAGVVGHHASLAAPTDALLLDTRLVSLHVAALLAAFGLLVLAFGCAALYALQHRMLKRKQTQGLFGKLPPLAGLDHLAFSLVAFAFPLLTLGLAAGAIAADSSPVQPWLLDHKVLASLATWLVYGAYLTLHLFAGWRGPRANFLLLAGLPIALLTYFVPTQLHHFG